MFFKKSVEIKEKTLDDLIGKTFKVEEINVRRFEEKPKVMYHITEQDKIKAALRRAAAEKTKFDE